jgi:hypothetical protein
MNRLAVFLVLLTLFTSTATAQKYFPDFSFHEDSRLDKQFAKSRISCLTAMSEPSLLEMSQQKALTSFRFTWLPAWDRPISVRVILKADGTSDLKAKSVQGSYWKPGKLDLAKDVALTNQQTAELLGLIEAAGFWTLPSRVPTSGRDGADWLFEGVKDGRYHLTERWSPNPGNYRNLGLFLIKLSGLRDSADVY